MTVGFPYLMCLLYTIIESSNSQYMPVKKTVQSTCDESNKTSLVEHFFNVIFSEFHHSPPFCVCVQMCENQPTYCYPNNCLKKVENKRTNGEFRPPVAHIQNDGSTKTMFLVDERNDLTQALNNAVNNAVPENAPKQPHSSTNEFFSDPLRDIYKTLFKYKKMPRVELRYNLREQVKNMKSDIFKHETDDVSKTRWPKTHHRIFYDQKANEKQTPTQTPRANIFLSNSPSSQEHYNSKYFKRDLRNTDDSDDRYMGLDDTAPEKGFSIEKLIEKLIGSSFDAKNETRIELRVFNDVNTTATNANTTNNKNNTSEMCVYSLNLTKENTDENKYIEESRVAEAIKKWDNYTFNEMITALSKQIDVQNNTSMEMIERNKDLSVMKEHSQQNLTNSSKLDNADKNTVKVAIKESNIITDSSRSNNTILIDNTNVTAVPLN